MLHFKETVYLLQNSSCYYTIAIGMDNRYLYVSPNYDKNFNFINDTLKGKPFHITLHPDDIRICAETGTKCFENPGQLFPATLRKHDGKNGFIFTQWELKAMFDENQAPYGIFCIGYNITEHVDAQKQLLSAKTEINIKNDQLNQIGFIQSHVVRKPLANILGLINVISFMEAGTNLDTIKTMLTESAKELDDVIKNITDKTS